MGGLRERSEPLGTAWPVVTEAMYLLGLSWRAQDALWEMVANGGLALLPLDSGDVPACGS